MKRKGQWIALGTSALLLVLFGLHLIYAYIMKDQWTEKRAAETAAKTQAGLVEITRAQKSVWDSQSIYWTLTGTDAAGQEMMVWVRFQPGGQPAQGENTVHAEPLKNGLDEARMREVIAKALPQASVERLLPGVYEGEYAWQLFYKQEGHYYYQFFRFADGVAIGNPIYVN